MSKKGLSKVFAIVAGAGIIGCSSGVMAQGTVNAKIGTLGGGLEYVHAINPKLAVGFGLNGLSYDDSMEESDINYDATLDMQSFSLIGDFHPFSNGFRLSAGALQNGNEFSLIGTPTGTEQVEIGGTTYTADQVGSLEGVIGFKSIAPYLGIGWGKKPESGKGWGVDADLGVLFQGTPEVSLEASCSADFAANQAAACNTLLDEVDRERESLELDTEDFELFPVVSLGVSYTF